MGSCQQRVREQSRVSRVSRVEKTETTSAMAWHKGTWWPLYVKEWYTPKASAHMFDPYSFCLVVAGLLLHLLWGTDSIDTWAIGFGAAVGLELVWELVGNTPLVLKRIRNINGACGEYIGDSIQNILGDLVSCALGYVLGTVFAAVEFWWISLIWIVASEVLCIVYMRDSLVLNLATLLVHSDKLRQWQLAKVPQGECQGMFARLWRPKQC